MLDITKFFVDIKDFTIESNNNLCESSKYFVVKHKLTNKNFFARELSVDQFYSPESQEKLIDDIKKLRSYNHFAINQFKCFSYISFREQKKWQPTILTEYAENQTLNDKLNIVRNENKSDDWNTTKKIINLLGISAAMKFLHDKRIIHCKLMPENIFLDKNFYPKVSIFELLGDFNNEKLIAKEYMSPEVLKDEQIGFQSDVYSFGIIAYEIITGIKPYSEVSDFDSIDKEQIINGSLRPKFPTNINKNICTMIEKCWDSDLTKRPSFNDIFTSLSENFNDYQDNIDENEIKNYLHLLSGNLSEKMPNHNDEKSMQKEDSDCSQPPLDNNQTLNEEKESKTNDIFIKHVYDYLSDQNTINDITTSVFRNLIQGDVENVQKILSMNMMDINRKLNSFLK